jgi:hypothetical protein
VCCLSKHVNRNFPVIVHHAVSPTLHILGLRSFVVFFVPVKMANTRALAFGFASEFDQQMSEPWVSERKLFPLSQSYPQDVLQKPSSIGYPY